MCSNTTILMTLCAPKRFYNGARNVQKTCNAIQSNGNKTETKRNTAEFVNIRTVLGLQGDVVVALALREARHRAFKSACVAAGLAQGL